MSGNGFSLPVNIGFSQPAQVAGVVISDLDIHFFGRFQLSFFYQPLKVLRGMQHFQFTLQAEFIVKYLEGIIAVRAAGNQCFGPCFLNQVNSLFGLFEENLPYSPSDKPGRRSIAPALPE